MQNAELYRRGVVLPLDQTAEDALRANDVSTKTKVRLLRIRDEGLFEALWRLGVFQEINRRCATLMDDFEEEIVEAASVVEIVASVDSIAGDHGHQPEVSKFLEDLRVLAAEAASLSRPLIFVL